MLVRVIQKVSDPSHWRSLLICIANLHHRMLTTVEKKVTIKIFSKDANFTFMYLFIHLYF